MIQIIGFSIAHNRRKLLWPSDHGGDNKESTICEGKLLPLSSIPPDCLGTQADESITRYVCQKQAA